MLFGSTTFGEISFAEIPDPNARRQGAIVVSLSTQQRYSVSQVETLVKVNATMATAPGR